MQHTLLTFDPGERNCAYSVTEFTASRVKLLETGFLQPTLINLTDKPQRFSKSDKEDFPPLQDGLNHFYRSVNRLFRKYKPSHVASERFQTRGIKSRSAETVSMMNMGIISTAARSKASYRLVMAASWKNYINKVYTVKQRKGVSSVLEELYVVGQIRGIAPHTVDTLMIAVYELVQNKSEPIKLTEEYLKKLIRKVEIVGVT